jgi:inositol transport system ATP-binding protein
MERGDIMTPLLTMSNITKSFSGVEVLHGVHLELNEGEVLGLIGENGAGKSTLMKILIGEERYDIGSIVLNGNEIAPHSPAEGLSLGISMIHQELTPIPEMTVAENLFIGKEPRRFGIVNKRKLLDMAAEQIMSLDLNVSPNVKVKELSVSQIQEMEIAKVLARGSKIVIMDEPTSSLTDSEINKLFKVIRNLKKQGISIIYISHKLEELAEIADRVTVLRDGEYIDSYNIEDASRDRMIRDMVGRELKDVFPSVEKNVGDIVLSVRGLSKQRKFQNISFDLRKGEILGFFGLVGAGRTEIVSTLFGKEHADGGSVVLNGQEISIRSPHEAIKYKIALVSEDRKQYGLNLLASVKDNLLMVIQKKLTKLGILKSRSSNKVVDQAIERFRVKVNSKEQIVETLSGGNQQKVVLSKWLLSEPEVIILDEPTRGIDVGAKAEIYRLIQRLVKEGRAVILISSEMPEIIGLCDRMIVLHEGKITGEFQKHEFDQEKILALAAG